MDIPFSACNRTVTVWIKSGATLHSSRVDGDLKITDDHPTMRTHTTSTIAPRGESATTGSTKLALKWLSLAIFLSSVASADVQLDANGCVTNFDPTVDYFSPEHRAMLSSTGSVPSTVTFATDFSIEYFRTFKILRNLKTDKVHANPPNLGRPYPNYPSPPSP